MQELVGKRGVSKDGVGEPGIIRLDRCDTSFVINWSGRIIPGSPTPSLPTAHLPTNSSMIDCTERSYH